MCQLLELQFLRYFSSYLVFLMIYHSFSQFIEELKLVMILRKQNYLLLVLVQVILMIFHHLMKLQYKNLLTSQQLVHQVLLFMQKFQFLMLKDLYNWMNNLGCYSFLESVLPRVIIQVDLVSLPYLVFNYVINGEIWLQIVVWASASSLADYIFRTVHLWLICRVYSCCKI